MEVATMPPSGATAQAAVLDPRLAGVWIKVRGLSHVWLQLTACAQHRPAFVNSYVLMPCIPAYQ